MRSPRISIVTVSCNQDQFLERAICSVLDQGYADLEYIVIDGGSTDESIAIIRKYDRYLSYWASERNRGQNHALNKGLSRCSGEMMGWLNPDDRYLPGALEAFAEGWRRDPYAGAWVGDAALADLDGRMPEVRRPGKLDRESLADWEENGFHESACLFSKKAWEQAGPIRESLLVAPAFDLWLTIAETHAFARIPRTVSAATAKPSPESPVSSRIRDVETWMALMRHGHEAMAKRLMLRRLSDRAVDARPWAGGAAWARIPGVRFLLRAAAAGKNRATMTAAP